MVYKASPSFGLFYFLFLIIGVYLLYNAVLVFLYSKGNQLYIHVQPLFFGLPSHSSHQSTE